MKKRLTQMEEFDIMKMVLDKFLWVGFIIMLLGLYKIFFTGDMIGGILLNVFGGFLLIFFVYLVVQEYEIL
ncbi:MAG: hypothetical protein PHT94_04905 [Candidatus Nanoarchaeia archaeon]|nr:hypothetical protein [Candidatus Nanoarchaeia archaeon]